MLTFGQLVQGTQALVGDTSTDSVAQIKQSINMANSKVSALMRRYFTRMSKTTGIVANQQYYQLPEDAVRVTGVVVSINGINYPLEEVIDEMMWRKVNLTTTGTIVIPTYYFVRGNNEIGLWPRPSQTTANALEVFYEQRQPRLTQDDFTTGTVTVAQNSQSITHSGTGFSQAMVGRYFQTTDGDGLWYRIGGYTSSSVLTLEQYYQGTSGSSRTFIIGEAPIIPEDYHESLIDYACYRYFLARKDVKVAGEFKNLWDSAMEEMQEAYSNKTSNEVIEDVDSYLYNVFNVPPNPMT